METKQTAIDWIGMWFDSPAKYYSKSFILMVLNQAKAMEKEQIIDAQIEGFGGYSEISEENDRKVAERYYNETYGKI